MIKSGAFFISPEEVQACILKHPAVAEVAAIGVPDKMWSEAVKAVVVLKPDQSATEQDIKDHCRNHLASFQIPKSVDFVERLPKDPELGKVLIGELRKIWWREGA